MRRFTPCVGCERRRLYPLRQTMLTSRSRLAAHPSCPRLMGHASHIHGASRPSGQRTQAVREPIYGRELEKDQLDRALKRKPRNILLILGPRNCGKTAIIQSFLEGRRHALYVDCRAIDSSNPTTFTSGLLKRLLPMAPGNQQQKLKELLLAVVAGSATFNEVFETLEEVFVAWKEKAQQTPTETYWPVLIIDEANALMSWADTHPAELRSLLQFFVKVSKQEGQCHVAMATSEFGYQTWLNNGVCAVKATWPPACPPACLPASRLPACLVAIGAGFWQPKVIGDFPESEARQFLFQLLGGVSSDDGSSIDKDDKAWAAVYEVCGGNAGTLARLANELQQIPGCNWEEALRELWQVELDRARRLSLGGEGFKEVHFAAAALALLDRQEAWSAVRLKDMQELLGKYVEETASKKSARAAGAAVLERLVQANALSVRPPSAWARDIPVEAFGNRSIVTAPSTMDLYCMRRIRLELEEVLEQHDSAWEAQ